MQARAPIPPEEYAAGGGLWTWFFWVWLGVAVAICYAAAFLNADGALVSAEAVERVLPQAAKRIELLAAHDLRSLHAYTATLASGLVIVPLTVAVFAVGYWKTVVSPGRCQPVGASVLIHISACLAFSWGFMWAVFFEEWPLDTHGKGFSVLWPVFPFWAGPTLALVGKILLVAFVGLFKLILGPRGHNR
ncbi:hypothetical protein [Citreimonas sp.]|uniref:hypothetical protein n=1 Tax=Citreimonas sp. TaxID=3036715 RepID=UPI0035C7E34E